MIDSIDDKEQQIKIIAKVLTTSKRKLKLKVEVVVNPTYNMTEILSRMKKEKPLFIQDLRAKINALKVEVVQLKEIE